MYVTGMYVITYIRVKLYIRTYVFTHYYKTYTHTYVPLETVSELMAFKTISHDGFGV